MLGYSYILIILWDVVILLKLLKKLKYWRLKENPY